MGARIIHMDLEVPMVIGRLDELIAHTVRQGQQEGQVV